MTVNALRAWWSARGDRTMQERWVDAALVTLRARDADLAAGEIAVLDAAWEALAARTDFRADVEREVLRPKLQAAFARRDARREDIALRELRQDLVNVLMPQY